MPASVFPTFGMNAFAQAWGAILPVRWYMAVLLKGRRRADCHFPESARPFAALAGLAVLYALLALLRLRVTITRSVNRAAAAPAPSAPAETPRGIGGAFAAEWRRVLAIPGAFILLVVAPLVYGKSSTRSPISIKILRKIPIAVVDNDLSELSRRIVQTLDAQRCRTKVAISARHATASARSARPRRGLRRGRHPARDRARLTAQRHHRSRYSRSTPMRPTCSHLQNLGQRHRSRRSTRCPQSFAAGGARTDGSLVKATLASVSPPHILLQPNFNPDGGYARYIVPAAFVLDPAGNCC